jgi:hypothetical protein
MSAPTDDNSHRNAAVQIWIKVVQTQEHFNEIGMKVRTMYATVMAGILSLYGIFVEHSSHIVFWTVSIDAIIPICFAIILMSTLFYFVDRYWYHRLLMGAVKQGAYIENRWKEILPELGMGQKISDESSIDLNNKKVVLWIAKRFVSDPELKTTGNLHSDGKIELFYKPVRMLAVILLVAAILLGGVRFSEHSIAYYIWYGATAGYAGVRHLIGLS